MFAARDTRPGGRSPKDMVGMAEMVEISEEEDHGSHGLDLGISRRCLGPTQLEMPGQGRDLCPADSLPVPGSHGGWPA